MSRGKIKCKLGENHSYFITRQDVVSIMRHSLSVLYTGRLRILVILESNQEWPGVLERVCVSMSCFYLQLDDKKQSQLWCGHWAEGSLGCHRPWGLNSTRIMGAGAMGVEGSHSHPATWWRLWMTQSRGITTQCSAPVLLLYSHPGHTECRNNLFIHTSCCWADSGFNHCITY